TKYILFENYFSEMILFDRIYKYLENLEIF
ncbi:unnamed protein product, partial [marine sediment metagenome]